MRCLVTWVLGIWRGEGLGKGLRKGRSVYKQPETEVDGSCHSKEGSKLVDRGWKGEQRGISKGRKKQGECAMYIVTYVRVYNECL